MGIEIVFVLIYPVALASLIAATWFWFSVAKNQQTAGMSYVRAYMPLVAGFAVSMLGLAILTGIESSADFTALIQQGYYTESQRAIYLPSRTVGQGIVSLVFVLPLMCFVVVPITAGLIRAGRLKLSAVVVRAAIAWVALSLIGWLLSLGLTPPYSLLDFFKSTAVPVLAYGLPIPLAALLLFRHREEA